MKFLNYQTIFAFVAVFASFSDITSAIDSGCGTADWQPYKDERCFRILDDTLRTFDDAVEACRLESTSTLSKIRTLDEQIFVANFLFKTNRKVDNFWLGAKFENNSYKWQDKSALTYTNWATAARNMTDYCVQIQADVAVLGKWIDGPCEKKNLVVCEKSPTFSAGQLHEQLVGARRELRDALDVQKHQLDEANKRITEQAQKLELADKKIVQQRREFRDALDQQKHQLGEQKQLLEESNRNIIDLKKNLIPIGFVYPQLPNEKSPTEMWPWMTWTDVSSTYAGVFFRVNGGDAAPIGQVQEDNAPRVTQIKVEVIPNYRYAGEKNLTKNGWTEPVFTGSIYSDNSNFLKFFTSGGEVRPRNMAIRIWKRTR